MLRSTRPKSKRERARERNHNSDFTVISNSSISTPEPLSASSNIEVLHRHETVNASSDHRASATFKNRYFGIFQSLTDEATWRRLGTRSRLTEPLIDVDILDYHDFDLADLGFEPLDPLWSDNIDEDSPDDGDNPLKNWVEQDRDRDLQEILRLDGRGDYSNHSSCYQCKINDALYQCLDCDRIEMFCNACIVGNHLANPLHRIKKWNQQYFEPTTLKSLGLRVQLGHMIGQKCVNPRASPGNGFTVVDSNGIHDISLDFCDCETAQSHAIQILRKRWFPSTGTYPKTAATMRVLKQFHLLAFESKLSSYEFYNSLVRNTDNTGLGTDKDCYDEFTRMYRKWTNLTMAKRAGRGHDSRGVNATQPGECALLCPACPQPGKNLPLGWENEPPEKSWIYGLFLAIDANFRLTRRHVSSEDRDPGLGNGWAFFVQNIPYQEHLKRFWDYKQPKSTCVNHEACNNSEKEVQGKSVTGGGTVDCARHNFKRPCGFGDLQKGESIMRTAVKRIFVSYDIACQWYKNIWQRMGTMLPAPMHISSSVDNIQFLVPKFHIAAHIQECILKFSFNTTKYVGRTDGEAPERGWSATNALATSTREMGPGFRRDTLDDHFNDWNWKKITGLGASLLKKIKKAVPQAAEHMSQRRQFESVLPTDDIKKWTQEVELWELSKSSPNPYQALVKSMTEAEVRLLLAQKAAATQDEDVVHSNVHPSILISQGLQLEEQQRKLAREVNALGQHATPSQIRVIQESSNKLRRRITAWTEVQSLYMPHAAVLRQKDASAMLLPGGSPSVKTENLPLYLPSSFGSNMPCDPSLRIFEWQLRQGQAFDALHEIRQNLRVASHYIKHKKRFSRGVAQNTRSNTTIKTFQEKADHAGEKYRVARAAMVHLSAHVGDLAHPGWQSELKPLREEDMRNISEGQKGETDGRRTISWIWLTEGVSAIEEKDKRMHEALRIEWCHNRARAMRWSEEIVLLQEEMRRTLAFFEWQANWWTNCGGSLEHVQDKVTKEGLVAYRQRQAALRLTLRDRFAENWKDVSSWVAWGEAKSQLEELDDLDNEIAVVDSIDNTNLH
ncbi:hypothetical protein JR316_0004759 [Psilocybe cubensis]|uniref:Uncharacterized protein n=1 Tax=Psilocybe cubensis TaxID=181762 RepID=A0ACB8H644_PSICU|nr:hypothetical protein JR316_0004759 [Psilocybe cubensis]KAH9482659.1 hypothetical protein JR316_0004759 [Psilocybe cubensis]